LSIIVYLFLLNAFHDYHMTVTCCLQMEAALYPANFGHRSTPVQGRTCHITVTCHLLMEATLTNRSRGGWTWLTSVLFSMHSSIN